MKLDSIWEQHNLEQPDTSMHYIVSLVSFYSAYQKDDSEMALDMLEQLVIDACYEVSDAEKEYTYIVND